MLSYLHISETVINKMEKSNLGHWAVAYLCYKIATPVRYAVTLGIFEWMCDESLSIEIVLINVCIIFYERWHDGIYQVSDTEWLLETSVIETRILFFYL